MCQTLLRDATSRNLQLFSTCSSSFRSPVSQIKCDRVGAETTATTATAKQSRRARAVMGCSPRFLSGLLLCLWAAGAGASWGGRWAGPRPAHRDPRSQNYAKLIMADVINRLGVKLLAIQNEYNENNIAISPYGALSVLIALGEGLQGDAVREIQLALQIPNDISIIRQGLRDINRHLQSYFIPKEGFLAGLTLNYDSVSLKPQYQDILLYYGYDLTAFNVALYPPPPKMPPPSATTSTSTSSTTSTTTTTSTVQVDIKTTTTTTEIPTTVDRSTTNIVTTMTSTNIPSTETSPNAMDATSTTPSDTMSTVVLITSDATSTTTTRESDETSTAIPTTTQTVTSPTTTISTTGEPIITVTSTISSLAPLVSTIPNTNISHASNTTRTPQSTANISLTHNDNFLSPYLAPYVLTIMNISDSPNGANITKISTESTSSSSELGTTIPPTTDGSLSTRSPTTVLSGISSIVSDSTSTNPDVETTPVPFADSTNELLTNVPTTQEPVGMTTQTTESATEKVTEYQRESTTELPAISETTKFQTVTAVKAEEVTVQQTVTTEATAASTTDHQILTAEALPAGTIGQEILTTEATTSGTTEQKILTTEDTTAGTTEQQMLTNETMTVGITEQKILTTEATAPGITEQQILTTEAMTAGTIEQEILTNEAMPSGTTEQKILTTEDTTAGTTEQQMLANEGMTVGITEQVVLTTEATAPGITEQKILTTEAMTAGTIEQEILTNEAMTAGNPVQEILTTEATILETTEQKILATEALTADTTEQQTLTTEAAPAGFTQQQILSTEATTAAEITTKAEKVETTITNSEFVTNSVGFAGSPKQKRMSPQSSISLNKWAWTDNYNNPRRRVAKSVSGYVDFQKHYDDTMYRYPKPIDPLMVQEPLYFLAQGRYKDYNVNFMRYNTALPVCDVVHLDARALKFPLDRKEYYLLILLPNKHNGVDKLIRDLRVIGDFGHIVDCLRTTHVDVTIPSFKMNGYVKLTNLFQRMGIRKVFEPNQGDFTPMTDQDQIYVTNIEQAITVDIKHYVDIENMSRQASYPWEFKADHPFLFFVLDSELQVTLMSGKITNPLNTRIS